VHYVFADDDPELLTAALAHHHRGAYDDDDANGDDDDDDNDRARDRAVILDMEPTADGSGLEVTWASSLSPDWAVTSARLSSMAIEGGGAVGGGGGGDGGVAAGGAPNSGLVLKIEGVSIEPSSSSGGPMAAAAAAGGSNKGVTPPEGTELQSSSPGIAGRQQQATPAVQEYTDLLHEFDKRMRVLRRVVEAGAARQRAAAAAAAAATGDGLDQVSEATTVRKG
jgi:hypothetical protein